MDHERNLIYVTKLADFYAGFEREEFIIPDFQRAFIWDDNDIQLWSKTIHENGIIPDFLLGRYNTSEQWWICDGRQRLEATWHILATPEKYGFSGREAASKAISRCPIAVHQVVFESRHEAYTWFVRLNSSGSVLTMAELYKGDLVNGTCQHGERVHGCALQWLIPSMSRVCRDFKENRGKLRPVDSVRHRGALALFYHFISDYTGYTFWEHAQGTPQKTKTVESFLAEHLMGLSGGELGKAIIRYQQFIEKWTAVFRTILDKTYPAKTVMGDGLFRHLLFFTTWATRHGYSETRIVDMHQVLISACRELNQKAYKSKPDDKPYIHLQSNTLTRTWTVLREAGISLDIGTLKQKPKRKKRLPLIAGYDHSHLQPFSVFGEGEVITEPSIINRSRGAAPIDETDSH